MSTEETHPRLSASLANFHPPTTATTTAVSSKGHCQHHQEQQQQQQQIKFYCADSPNNFVDALAEQNDEQCSISTQWQTTKSFSNATDRTAVTHCSMTKSDASCGMDHDTENLESIVEEEHFMGDDVLMDDASAHSFDIPDLDQWEIRGFEDGEEDANSQCSVVALDGGEDDLLEPLNLSCFSDQGDSQKKKKWQQEQPVINELEDLPQSTPFASWGQADGANNSSQVSPHPQAVLKSHSAANNMTSSSFAPFPSSENQTTAWSSTTSMVQSSNGDSSSMGFYPGMSYDTYSGSSDMLAGQYHHYPHQGYSTTTNDQISQAVHSQPSGDNFHNGWTGKPSAMMHQSDPNEMLQARLGLSSFRPVDQFGSNYEQFSRASSVHAFTYSGENVDMKQRYGTVSVASAPAGTSWNRNGGNVHMGNHHGYGEGAYNSSMHHGYGKGRGHSASTMSVHSLDYPRRNNASCHPNSAVDLNLSMRTTHGPSSLNEYPTYNNAFHGGHGGMYSSHHPLETSSSVFSAASGSYPPSAPSSSYYQEHHPNTEEQIIPMSSSGQHENNHDFHNADSPILHGTAVVNEMDKNLATNFSYAVLYEVESCSFESRDRTGKRRGLELGFRGLACRHCKGVAKKIGGRLFPSSIKTMSDTQKTLIPLYKHLIKCPAVPNETKERLYSLKDLHENERQNKTYGSQKAFFTEIWRRLHGKIPKDGK